MNSTLSSFRRIACVLFLVSSAYSQTIESHTSEIDGVKLDYLTAGHGAALVLLHGYTETVPAPSLSTVC